MHVHNVHERSLARPAAQVGALIDTLASDHDRLWPLPLWPEMHFDRPLGVGASGGHGPIGYDVEAYEPGSRVRFRFTQPVGFKGYHEFLVIPSGDDAAILRHTLEMETSGSGLLAWQLAVRHFHDASLEDALAYAEAALGLPVHVVPWGWYVRYLRRAGMPNLPTKHVIPGA